MTGVEFGGLLFGVCLVLIALRMPVAVAMFVVGGFGFASLAGWSAFLNLLNTAPFGRVSSYTLSVLPLFLLMGQLATRSGLSRALFDATRAWVGHRRGGLAVSTVFGCAAFGSICGSSIATGATMASVALPEMRRHGYSGALATGTLAAGGTLGILIPPSVILVIYAVITEQSVGKLFLAALLPGLIATLGYAVAIAVYVRLKPEAGPVAAGAAVPRPHPQPGRGVAGGGDLLLGHRRNLLRRLHPDRGGRDRGCGDRPGRARIRAAELVGLRIEPAGDRAGHRDDLPHPHQRRDIQQLPRAVPGPRRAGGCAGGLGACADIRSWSGIVLVYLILGCVMDSLAMILLTVPVFFPLVTGLDFGYSEDEIAIWFGILALIAVEIGLITPPIGLNVYVINSLDGKTRLGESFRGVVPFVLSALVLLAIILSLPAICLWLPGLG